MTNPDGVNRNIVLVMYLGTIIASLTNLLLFFTVTVFFAGEYLEVVGKLIHDNEETNRALLHLTAQGSILGGLGGSLFVFQILSNYIAQGNTGLMRYHSVTNYFLYSLVVPLKGLVAGLIGATIIGGIVMMVGGLGEDEEGGLKALRNAHLFIIGCACLAGYSEQFLQRVVDVASKKVNQL